jgi:peroxiredoxin/mono/diheme cytochrome c family protein
MSLRYLVLLTLAGLLVLLGSRGGMSADQAPASSVGKQLANFTLTEPRDQARVSLATLKDKKAVVVVFLGTQCPINNAYLPRLAELHKQYAPQGVQFLAINANVQDTPAKVAEHARSNDLPFPVLKDESNVVADQFGAQRTPEVFVLDGDYRIRYQGCIDDQFGIGYKRSQPTRRDLALALEEVLAGKRVSQPFIPAAGCLIARSFKPRTDGTVTYGREVARILQNRCQQCHRPGQIGPMALLTYDDATAWSETIREVIQENRMPPWHADPRYGKFSNDRRLDPNEREALLAWIEQGCPKGDDQDLPAAREWVPGWSIGKPDAIYTMKEPFEVPAVGPKNGIEYQYFEVDTGLTEDKWVVRAEAKPGATSVVHHIVVFIIAPGHHFVPKQGNAPVLCGTAPGDMPLMLPPGVGKRVPAGSKLVFQMHYTTNGVAAMDISSVGVIFAKEPPEQAVATAAVMNPQFRIPPGADNYEVQSWFTLKEDARILSFMPHLHLRGKDFLYEAVYPDGRKETLLSVPHYNFNWQSVYRCSPPVPLPKGSKIHCVAHFDNSAKNQNNPDPTQTVRWGDQTWEEMMIGWTDLVYDKK